MANPNKIFESKGFYVTIHNCPNDAATLASVQATVNSLQAKLKAKNKFIKNESYNTIDDLNKAEAAA